MSGIPDFSDSGLWVNSSHLAGTLRFHPEFQIAETGMRLDPGKTELSPCPTVYREAGECHFVAVRTGDRYRCQCSYGIHQMCGPGIEHYGDLSGRAVTLLQVQADHRAREPVGEPGWIAVNSTIKFKQ